jgi:starch-binding outer membrane protein, SusD/RagB family
MKKISLLLLLSITFLSSCKLLEQESPDNIPSDKVFETADGIRAAHGGMYTLWGNENYYGGYYTLALEAHSDNGATGGYVVESLDELGQKRLTPNNLFLERIWIAIYATTNSANQILENIDKNTTLEQAERDNIKGEALFVRALTHFDALKMFGKHWDNSSEYGIPVVLRTQTVSNIVARSTVQDTYTAILKDLSDAENLVNNNVKKGKIYITKNAVKALLARVYLFQNDKQNALKYAQEIIDSKKYNLFDAIDFEKLYSGRQTQESIFELKFDVQNRSALNGLTYRRDVAPRPDVSFFAAKDLNTFFENNKGDVRATTVDFVNNDASISPDGRSQKYRGESLQDNPAYILRYAEMILIAAEAKGWTNGLADLNTIRTRRGLTALSQTDVNTEAKFIKYLLDERRAEFNMEGQRFSDLARFNLVEEILGKDVKSVFPIPLREVEATKGAIKQYPGY